MPLFFEHPSLTLNPHCLHSNGKWILARGERYLGKSPMG